MTGIVGKAFLTYLIPGIDEQHPLLADADHARRGTTFLADLLGHEIVGTKQRQGGQDLWRTKTK